MIITCEIGIWALQFSEDFFKFNIYAILTNIQYKDTAADVELYDDKVYLTSYIIWKHYTYKLKRDVKQTYS